MLFMDLQPFYFKKNIKNRSHVLFTCLKLICYVVFSFLQNNINDYVKSELMLRVQQKPHMC